MTILVGYPGQHNSKSTALLPLCFFFFPQNIVWIQLTTRNKYTSESQVTFQEFFVSSFLTCAFSLTVSTSLKSGCETDSYIQCGSVSYPQSVIKLMGWSYSSWKLKSHCIFFFFFVLEYSWLITCIGKISWRREWLPIHYSCLENSMDRGAWWATVHGVCKESDRTEWLTFSFFHSQLTMFW